MSIRFFVCVILCLSTALCNDLLGQTARLQIGGGVVLNGGGGDELRPTERLHNNALNVDIFYPARQKSRYGHLIGTIHHTGTISPLAQTLIGGGQHGEFLVIHRAERQLGVLKKIETIITERLARMMADLRAELGAGQVPVVVGEIARWLPYTERINSQIHRAVTLIPMSACVSSEGCGTLRDESDPHFNREGELLLGERYAEQMILLQQSY